MFFIVTNPQQIFIQLFSSLWSLLAYVIILLSYYFPAMKLFSAEKVLIKANSKVRALRHIKRHRKAETHKKNPRLLNLQHISGVSIRHGGDNRLL